MIRSYHPPCFQQNQYNLFFFKNGCRNPLTAPIDLFLVLSYTWVVENFYSKTT